MRGYAALRTVTTTGPACLDWAQAIGMGSAYAVGIYTSAWGSRVVMGVARRTGAHEQTTNSSYDVSYT